MLAFCGESKALEIGKEVHQTIELGAGSCSQRDDLILSAALVSMYGKCGSLKDAQLVSYLILKI